MYKEINENLRPPESEMEAKLKNSEEYPCYACQGNGCEVCNGFGTLCNKS